MYSPETGAVFMHVKIGVLFWFIRGF
jgi:hypothetical protein